MSQPVLRCALLAAAIALVAVACAPDETAAPGPQGAAAAGAVVSTTEAPRCGPGDGATFEHPGWPVGAVTEPDFLPVVQSSLISVGPNRFLYNVLDPAYRQVAAPEVPSRIDFYALERDPETPAASVEASYLPSGLGRGLYRAAVDFDCVGEWGAEVSIELADGSRATERLRFRVRAAGRTAAIGAAAPRSDSPTATTIEEARRISTDTNPYLAAYDSTVAEAVTSGRPALIFFATPAFCQSGLCGPTVELVKSVAREYEAELEFVNVEPYQLHLTENGLQPLLDEDGQLQPVPAAVEYGIPAEPYLFVVDAEGDVFARFEVVVGGDELRAAIEDVLAGAA